AVPDRSSHVTATPSAVQASTGVATDGTQLFMGPLPYVLANLPIVDVGIPGQVEWDPRDPPQPLTQVVAARAGPSGRAGLRILYAVLSARAIDRWAPVVLVRDDRDGSVDYVSPGVTLDSIGTVFGEPSAPLTARAIDPTGTVVMFIQPHAVVVVDVTSGLTRTAPLPADVDRAGGPIVDGGFTDAGRIIVRTANTAWSVDSSTLAWAPVAKGAGPEDTRVDTTGGSSRILAADAEGAPHFVTTVHFPMALGWGESVATPEWIATGGVVDEAAVPERFRVPNALFLVSRSDPTVRRALVLGANAAGGISGGIRAIGVAGQIVLFQYSVEGRTWVLGVDPTTGLVSRVAEVWSPVSGVGSPNQVIALSPWAISHRSMS
ncbi:MAG: hypothetical protein ABI131_03305, partial [Nostocoides sp.]